MIVKPVLFLVALAFNQMFFASFAPNVLVRVLHGYRPINSFRGTDFIRSYREAEGVINCKVLQVATTLESPAIEIWLDEEVVVASPDQYFYSVPYKAWRMAKELVKGEQLLADSSNPVIVRQVHKIVNGLTLYNLDVADTHLYFVSKSRILVCGRII